MPGFADTLSLEQRWALIDWLRANNAGLAQAATGTWPFPGQAPGLAASCPDRGTVTLDTLHGQVIRIVLGPASTSAGVLTTQVTSDPAARPDSRVCIADAETALRGYAAVAGLALDELAGDCATTPLPEWIAACV